MASAAFKSTSRRGNETSNSSNKEPPKRRLQRSLSVSAVPRNQLDIDSDFLNKRDNPLFWSTTSPPDKETQQPEKSSGSQVNGATASKSAASAGQRGRSVTRNADFRGKKTIDRSLSRGHYGYGASEVRNYVFFLNLVKFEIWCIGVCIWIYAMELELGVGILSNYSLLSNQII